MLHRPAPLTVPGVFAALRQLAAEKGQGEDLIHACCSLLVWVHVLALHACRCCTWLARCQLRPSIVKLHYIACRRCRPAAAGRAVPADRLPGERASIPDSHAGSGARRVGLAVLLTCPRLAILPKRVHSAS